MLLKREIYIVVIFADELSVMNCIHLCLVVMWIAGLRQENPVREAVWQQAAAGTSEVPAGIDSKNNRSSWLVLVFMGIMFSGPYLVWKLISSLSNFQSLNRK